LVRAGDTHSTSEAEPGERGVKGTAAAREPQGRDRPVAREASVGRIGDPARIMREPGGEPLAFVEAPGALVRRDDGDAS